MPDLSRLVPPNLAKTCVLFKNRQEEEFLWLQTGVVLRMHIDGIGETLSPELIRLAEMQHEGAALWLEVWQLAYGHRLN